MSEQIPPANHPAPTTQPHPAAAPPEQPIAGGMTKTDLTKVVTLVVGIIGGGGGVAVSQMRTFFEPAGYQVLAADVATLKASREKEETAERALELKMAALEASSAAIAESVNRLADRIK